MNVAVAMLAYRDYSREQLNLKLIDKEFETELIQQVLDQLEASGIIDDNRYAAALIRSHIAKGHGPNKIKQSLFQKGIDKQCIENALENSDCDWFALARERAIKKFGNIPSTLDMKEKARRMRHLAGRGFSYDQISYALEPIVN